MKRIFYLIIATLIVVFIVWLIIDVTYSPGCIELITFKTEFDSNGNLLENCANLKWHGANGIELRIYLIVSDGNRLVDNELRYQTTNDGDAFKVTMPSYCPIVKIYYHHTEVTINSDGQLSERTFLIP